MKFNCFPIAWLSFLMLLCAPAHASDDRPAPTRELLLAGGALRLCSSLSIDDCTDPSVFAGRHARTAATFRFARDRIEAAIAAFGDDSERAALVAALLRHARQDSTLDSARLREALDAVCLRRRGSEWQPARCVGRGHVQPWRKLDDAERGRVIAALEDPQFAPDGSRRRELVSLDHGREPAGAAIVRAFVAAAARRAPAGQAPRIAVVTASSNDPFDAVDFYLAAFDAAGADTRWWPLDAALSAAAFGDGDCAALAQRRLPGRARVFPDLVALQQAACADSAALAAVPGQVDGVFFSGGDQWLLRQAFFDRDDRPNPALVALRSAHARGALVVGGTSAGMAVQSDRAMLGNGDSAQALRTISRAIAPPEPGCARSGRCTEADEAALAWWPGGGFGLLPGFVFDTHFSERARELRLLRVLADAGLRFGIGADETSAVHLRWRDPALVEVEALGAQGAWLFDRGADPHCEPHTLHAHVHYLAAGAIAEFGANGVALVDADQLPTSVDDTREPAIGNDALADGALRHAARQLARNGASRRRLDAGGSAVVLARTRETRGWGAAGHAGAFGLTLSVDLPKRAQRDCAMAGHTATGSRSPL
jgi:cyanophycinase-like exopeptidase